MCGTPAWADSRHTTGGGLRLILFPRILNEDETLLVFEMVIAKRGEQCLGRWVFRVTHGDDECACFQFRVFGHFEILTKADFLGRIDIVSKKMKRAESVDDFQVGNRSQQGPIPSAPSFKPYFRLWVPPFDVADAAVVNRRAEGNEVTWFASGTGNGRLRQRRNRNVRQLGSVAAQDRDPMSRQL